MDTIKFDKRNTKMVAHRGASGLECENTVAAFIAAGNRSYFGIETDVHVTADGKFVVHHDDSTERLCDRKIIIEESSFDEVKSLCITKHRTRIGADSRRDLVIPTLDDYISICKYYGKVAVLELKNRIARDKVSEILKLIDSYGWLERTILISFCWDNLADAKKLRPVQNVQFLTGDFDKSLVQKLKDNDFDLDIQHNCLDEKVITTLHENGIKINCWTCDSSERAEKLTSFGVDYITSNILE